MKIKGEGGGAADTNFGGVMDVVSVQLSENTILYPEPAIFGEINATLLNCVIILDNVPYLLGGSMTLT